MVKGVLTAGMELKPFYGKGALHIQPDATRESLNASKPDVFVLPGGGHQINCVVTQL